MFNLLVKFGPWAAGRDGIPKDRVFEYTEQALIDRFKPGNQLDLSSLAALPTLFVEETAGEGHQVARVGTITRTRIIEKNIALEYNYDTTTTASEVVNQTLPSLAPRTLTVFAFDKPWLTVNF